MNAIETVVRSISGATFANADYTIPAKAYIRKGATDGSGATNPLWNQKDDIKCVVTGAQLNLGVVYGNAVQNRIVGKGSDVEYDVDKMYGKQSHIAPHKLLCQNTDRSKTYLRYMPVKSSNKVSTFILNGVDVTAQLKPFMAKKSDSRKQAKAGLNDAEQVQWRTLDIANVDALNLLGMTVTN